MITEIGLPSIEVKVLSHDKGLLFTTAIADMIAG